LIQENISNLLQRLYRYIGLDIDPEFKNNSFISQDSIRDVLLTGTIQ